MFLLARFETPVGPLDEYFLFASRSESHLISSSSRTENLVSSLESRIQQRTVARAAIVRHSQAHTAGMGGKTQEPGRGLCAGILEAPFQRAAESDLSLLSIRKFIYGCRARLT